MVRLPAASSVLFLCLIVIAGPSIAAQVAAGQAPSQTVTVSGLVTDASTGRPIAGAKVFAQAANSESFYGEVRTSNEGYFERQLAPGRYLLSAGAPGFYTQSFLGSPAHNDATAVEVTASGPNKFDTALVPDTNPYIGATTAMAWTHENKEPFTSMALELRYSAYAAVPPNWSADVLVSQIVDSQGRILGTEDTDITAFGGGGSIGGFSAGSTDGCEYFNSSKLRPDAFRLSVVAYLRSYPERVTTTPVVPDSSLCRLTKLWVSKTAAADRMMALIRVDVLHRTAAYKKISGTMSFTINNRRKINVQVRPGAASVTKNLARYLRSGRNSVRIAFAPADPYFSAPPSRVVAMRAPNQRPR